MLQHALGRAEDGEPSLILMTGESGVGKTRLLTEFGSRCSGRVLWGSCLPLGELGLPFAPIVEMLRRWADEPSGPESVPDALAALLSLHWQRVPGQARSRSQLFESILSLFEDLARESVTVIVVEDLHWADRSTRDLLSYLVLNLYGQRLLIVGSYRTDGLGREHPLRVVLAELGRRHEVVRMDLAPFTPDQVREQLHHLTGRAPSPEAHRLVMARTQGNPYFVEELVAADGLDGGDLPTSLRDLLLVRADVVTPGARRLLRIASLCEGDIDSRLAAQVSGESMEDARAHLHETVDAHLLVHTEHGVRFRHALLREALQQDLLVDERREYHRAYAGALEMAADDAAGGPAAASSHLAHHLQAAGDLPRALATWIAAADAAEEVFAYAEAHHFLAQALASWDVVRVPERPDQVTRVGLLRRAAGNAFMGGDPDAACLLVREAISAVDARQDPSLAGVLFERLSRYLRDTAEHDQIEEAITKAVDLVPSSPPSAERARVLAGLAGRLITLGRYEEAMAPCSEAVAMARLLGEATIECDALNTLGAATFYLADESAGLHQINAALDMAIRIGDAHQQMRAHWNRVVYVAEAGDWVRAVEYGRMAIDALPRLGLARLVPELYNYGVQDLMTLGRWDDAGALVEEAIHRFPDSADEVIPREFLIARGDFDEARRLITAAGARDVFVDREEQALVQVDLAELETWQGDTAAARAAVDAALDLVVDTDRPIAAARALTVAARCEADAAVEASARGSSDGVELARERGEGHLRQLRTMLSRPGPHHGWKREVGTRLAVCLAESTRWQESPEPKRWEEAAAATGDLSMEYLRAYALLRHSEAILLAGGPRERAVERLTEAHRMARSMGARPLLELIEAFGRRARVDLVGTSRRRSAFGLTPRENEVLHLLARGATNRAIAEALFISEKTASVHVSNIMRKLGAGNRAEAASLAYRRGLVDIVGSV